MDGEKSKVGDGESTGMAKYGDGENSKVGDGDGDGEFPVPVTALDIVGVCCGRHEQVRMQRISSGLNPVA